MKEIGDKLRRCTDGTCSLDNVSQIVDKVLNGHHVAVLVYYFIPTKREPFYYEKLKKLYYIFSPPPLIIFIYYELSNQTINAD